MFPNWEPLLPDDRVDKIATRLRLAHPDLREAEFLTFVVPDQFISDRSKMRHAPHDPDCLYRQDKAQRCQCDGIDVPPQAVFAIRSRHPRTWDPVYRGKDLLSTESMWLSTWEREAKARSHYVSTSEDPAYDVFRLAAKAHLNKIEGYGQLI